eukprot:scaffold30397_cov18-Tisochrysis_lutea.AAC.1
MLYSIFAKCSIAVSLIFGKAQTTAQVKPANQALHQMHDVQHMHWLASGALSPKCSCVGVPV